MRNQFPDQRYSIPGSPTNQFGYNTNDYIHPQQNNPKDDFFSSLRNIFGQTSERPARRSNPYSKLRERNKREAEPEWRGEITRAPYIPGQDQV